MKSYQNTCFSVARRRQQAAALEAELFGECKRLHLALRSRRCESAQCATVATDHNVNNSAPPSKTDLFSRRKKADCRRQPRTRPRSSRHCLGGWAVGNCKRHQMSGEGKKRSESKRSDLCRYFSQKKCSLGGAKNFKDFSRK